MMCKNMSDEFTDKELMSQKNKGKSKEIEKQNKPTKKNEAIQLSVTSSLGNEGHLVKAVPRLSSVTTSGYRQKCGGAHLFIMMIF